MFDDTPKRGVGRPTLYTEELGQRICDLIAAGHTEHQIERMEGMPTRGTINVWAWKNPDFRTQRLAARDVRTAGYEDTIAHLAETVAGESSRDRASCVDVAMRGMQWLCKVGNAHRYADRQAIEHSGGVPMRVVIVEDAPRTDAE